MNLRQAAQQALEALEPDCELAEWYVNELREKAINALHAALAEPEQEPVGWQWLDTCNYRKKLPANAIPEHWRPLYTAAPTPRKPLHDMAVFDLADKHLYEGGKNYGVLAFARAIERAHGIGERHE